MVNQELLENEKCMNLKPGGEGGHIDEIHLKKMHIGATRWLHKKWKDENYLETRKKRTSENNKILHERGILRAPNWTGKRHNKETKRKFSESRKGKGNGEKNSQYGKVWIFNESLKKNLSISTDVLEIYLNEGWKRGRKMKF